MIRFTDKEELFFTSNFLDKQDFIGCIGYMHDIIRKKYEQLNNVCPINYNSHRLNQNNMLVVYAHCAYFNSGCCRYKFCICLNKRPLEIQIHATGNNVKHPKQMKKHQLRGIARDIQKRAIKTMKASNWRDKQLCARSKKLKRLGNNQQMLSKDAARKLKSEECCSHYRDLDPHLDLCKMAVEDKWKPHIQSGLYKETYLFSKKPLEILHAKKRMIIKRSRNTLFFDSTGNVIPKFDPMSKRIFLYSLVAHIKSNRNCKRYFAACCRSIFK